MDENQKILEETLKSKINEGSFRELTDEFTTEPRGRYRCNQGVLIVPSKVKEIAAIVQTCNQFKAPIIPFGGGTGLVGGQIYQGNKTPVIISLQRLNKIRSLCGIQNVITAEAGCTLESIQQGAKNINREFPLSIASKGSCQIGGNLSTNAGGVHVIRYGNIRDLCLGIEAVLPDGQIYHGLSNLRKNNLGLDLKNLLIGSEGILGLITAATLRIFYPQRSTATALFSINTLDEMLAVFEMFQTNFGQNISAFELISKVSFEFLMETNLLHSHPFKKETQWYCLIELGTELEVDIEEKLVDVATKGIENNLIVDGIFAQSEGKRKELWKIRETIPEANNRIGRIITNDISLPINKISEFIEKTTFEINKLDHFRINCFGHLGDGNLHFTIASQNCPPDQYPEETKTLVRDIIKENVERLRGSVAAEHGTGRLHASYLENHSDKGFMHSIRSIKRALDPNNVMNPGVIIPVE